MTPDSTYYYVVRARDTESNRDCNVTELAEQTYTNGNLILNPSAEAAALENWTIVSGSGYSRRNSNSPHPDGFTWHFSPEVVLDGEIRQDIDVSSFQDTIDAGSQSFAFSGYVSCYVQNPCDKSRQIVEYRDDTMTILDSYDSGYYCNPSSDAWTQNSDTRTAPIGTRWIRIRLLSHRDGGTDNNGYHDALSLIAVCP